MIQKKSQNNLQLIYLIFLNKIFTIVGILKEKNIKGMTIGLAMNSVYYYQKRKMETYSKELDDKEIENKVNKWLRNLNKIKSQ